MKKGKEKADVREGERRARKASKEKKKSMGQTYKKGTTQTRERSG